MTETETENNSITKVAPKKNFKRLIPDLLLIVLLIVGASYRLIGLAWDADQHVHQL